MRFPEHHTKPISIKRKVVYLAKALLYCFPIINTIIYLAVQLLFKNSKEKPIGTASSFSSPPVLQVPQIPKTPMVLIPQKKLEKTEIKEEVLGQNFWPRLPKEVALHLLSYLDDTHLKKMASLSKYFEKLSGRALVNKINGNKSTIYDDEKDDFEKTLKFLKTHGEDLRYLGLKIGKKKVPFVKLINHCKSLSELSSIIDYTGDGDESLIELFSAKFQGHFPLLKKFELAPSKKGTEALKALGVSSNFQHVEDFKLWGDHLGLEGAEVLAKNNPFPHLKTLSLYGPQLETLKISPIKNIQAVAASPNFPHLQTLELDFADDLKFEAMESLAASPHFTQLKTLHFKGLLGVWMMQFFAASPNFPNLERLIFEDYCSKVINIFSQAKHFRKLRVLELNFIGKHRYSIFNASAPISIEFYKEIEALATSGNFPELEVLDLSNNSLGDKVLMILAACPFFPKLNTLYLKGNDIKGEGLEAFATSPYFPNLHTLVLDSNFIGVNGLKALAASPFFQNLRNLKISVYKADEGLIAFLNSPFFPKLNDLTIHGSYLNKVAFALAASLNFLNLRKLDLSFHRFRDNAVKAVIRSVNFPHLELLNLKPSSKRVIKDKNLICLLKSTQSPQLLKARLDLLDKEK